METQRNSGKITTEVGGFSGRALCPLSDPSPTARPVGSCSPKAAAARGAEDAERRLGCGAPPVPASPKPAGARWRAPGRSRRIGDWPRPPPAPIHVPSPSQLGTPAPGRAKAAIQRARVQPPPPRAPAAPAPRRDPGETDPPTDSRSCSILEEWVMAGRAVGLFLPGLGHPFYALCFSERRTKGRGFGRA